MALALAVALISRTKSDGQLKRTCAELQQTIVEQERNIAELQARLQPTQGVQATRSDPRVPNDPTAAMATEAEIQRRLAEVSVLKSNAADLVGALVTQREAPEAAEIPEHLDRQHATVSVLQKRLDEARQKSGALYNQTKEMLITMNIPPEIASLKNEKALASVELQHYWPFFEARKQAEVEQTFVERLKMRVLEEQIESEILAEQQRLAAQKKQ